jgi:hypothetical protein
MFAKDKALFYQALHLLHSDEPDSEKKLFTLLQEYSAKSEAGITKNY